VRQLAIFRASTVVAARAAMLKRVSPACTTYLYQLAGFAHLGRGVFVGSGLEVERTVGVCVCPVVGQTTAVTVGVFTWTVGTKMTPA
jgi:uncharacterized protein YaaW (UPF0174 family)